MDNGNGKSQWHCLVSLKENKESQAHGRMDSWRDFHNRRVSTLQGLATAVVTWVFFLGGIKQTGL